VVKNGPQAYKTATLAQYGNKETGEVRKTELRVRTWHTKRDGPGFDFDSTEAQWYCEGVEITRVKALLDGLISSTGRYRLVPDGSPLDSLIAQLESDANADDTIAAIAGLLTKTSGAIKALAKTDAGKVLSSGLQIERQGFVIDRLEAVARHPRSTEADLQAALNDEWWMFGGRFIDRAKRRSLHVLDQLDIPLIRSDGSLHVVELKKANISDLVIAHRSHHIVGPGINEAVGQAMNYLRTCDEERPSILTNLGIDCRRAAATVVIGHVDFVNGVDRKTVLETLRTYNSHLSRVQVITYDELIAGARQALSIST
jgi:hypothetical protein